MKPLLLFVLFFCAIDSYSQDTLKMQQIEFLVKAINKSDLKIQQDSIFQDHPEMGLSMKTYLTMALDSGGMLQKFENKVNGERKEGWYCKKNNYIYSILPQSKQTDKSGRIRNSGWQTT